MKRFLKTFLQVFIREKAVGKLKNVSAPLECDNEQVGSAIIYRFHPHQTPWLVFFALNNFSTIIPPSPLCDSPLKTSHSISHILITTTAFLLNPININNGDEKFSSWKFVASTCDVDLWSHKVRKKVFHFEDYKCEYGPLMKH